MMKTLGLSNGNSVVDFGCGVGRYTIPLSQAVGNTGRVTAIERNKDEIQTLNERITQYPTKAPIECLHTDEIFPVSIKQKTVDALLAFDVLQYVDDWQTFFQSVCHILKPSGIIHIYPAAVPHPNAVDLYNLSQVLADSGFCKHAESQHIMMHNKHIVVDMIHTYHYFESKVPNKSLERTRLRRATQL